MDQKERKVNQSENQDTPIFRRTDLRDRHLPEWYIRAHNVIMYVLGVIEVLLGLRLLFKLLGANPGNSFVNFLYSLTNVFVIPFKGIFRTVATEGGAANYVFEPATAVAMIMYGIIAYGVVRLIRLRLPA